MDIGNRLFAAIVAIGLAAMLSACGSGSNSTSANPPIIAGTPIAPAPPAVPFADAKFAFAPVTGAPATVLINISAQLGKEAFAQHVTLVPTDDPTVTYVVKGYLSAVGDVSGTILVYVWDVFDTSGRRVHRISGQETSATGALDPWGGVDAATAANVARRTIAALVAWGTGSTSPTP